MWDFTYKLDKALSERNGLMDFSEVRAIDSLHNEGTNTLVMGGLG